MYRYYYFTDGITTLWANYAKSCTNPLWKSLREDIKKYNGTLCCSDFRKQLSENDYYVDFETEEDFIVWKLKFS